MPKKVVYLVVLVFFLLFHPPVFADITVVINELLPTPSSGNDWVELYNPSQNDIDVSGWIFDDEGTSSDMLKIPDNTIIVKQSFKLFYVSNRLNKDGDTIYLNNGTSELDKYQYISSETDVSFGRYSDGSISWNTCSPTPESANSNCEVIVDPTPTPTPDPSPSSSASQSTSTKSPTPTPKATSTTTKSPSPTSAKLSPQVLSAASESSLILASSTSASTSPIPSMEATQSALSKTKVAGLLVGSGLALIGLSIGFYFWYHRVLGNPKKEQSENKT